jgi:hypothetical protein
MHTTSGISKFANLARNRAAHEKADCHRVIARNREHRFSKNPV